MMNWMQSSRAMWTLMRLDESRAVLHPAAYQFIFVLRSSPSLFPLQRVGSDETGLNFDDIQLVMARTGCSRSKAIECLEGSNGNLVMAVTLIEMVCNNNLFHHYYLDYNGGAFLPVPSARKLWIRILVILALALTYEQ